MNYTNNNVVTNLFLQHIQQHIQQLNIINPLNEKIPIKLWSHQKNVIESFITKQKIISTSSRQMGMTTLMSAMAHWYGTTYPNKTIFYTSHNQSMVHYDRDLFKTLDSNIQFEKCTRNELVLTNGTKIIFGNMKSYDCDINNIDMILIDNAAYIKNINKHWQNILTHNIKPDTFVWINSTPTTDNTWFARLYNENNIYEKIHLPWNKHENRDINWYNKTMSNYNSIFSSNEKINTELNAEFVS